MSFPQSLSKHGDLVLVALVLGVLGVLFAPIPAGLLDFLLLTNVSFAFLILMLTFYMEKPIEFSTFPSLLLIATLFRLSLNVSATRLILSGGDVGRVIASIGSYVVAGNYVIGLIVFLILIVVQYVVVTNGAQRISEVAARFTLDSMPGQQMAIDADLNMGFIDQAEAQRRRKNIEREAAFYGAMDGASKFVKGDAIAGIIILLVNSIGGLVVGVMQHGMGWSEALQRYTLLTVGDGIVTQVPALVIAVGTGIIVTRSASDSNLSVEALRQITSHPKTLLMVAGILSVLLLVPGIPLAPNLILVCAVSAVAFYIYRTRNTIDKAHAEGADLSQEAGAPQDSDPRKLLAIDPIEVFMGSNWAPRIKDGSNVFLENIASFRNQLVLDLGVILPAVRFKDGRKLEENRYEIYIDGVPTGKGEARFGQLLAIHPNGDTTSIPGDKTKDPTYGLPALWIAEHQKELAVTAKFTVIDADTVFVTHLVEALRKEVPTLLTRREAEKLISRVRETQPALVEELIPTVLSVGDVQKVLQHLLKERVSVRNMEAILETLSEAGRHTKEIPVLTENVRIRLGKMICQSLLGEASALQVMTLDSALESQFLYTLQVAQQDRHEQGKPGPTGLPMDPKISEMLMQRIAAQAEKMMKNNLLPVLLCAPELRRHIRTLTERLIPHLRVLSMAEIPQNIELRSWGVIQLKGVEQ